MKLFLRIAFCFCLSTGAGLAQRGGGGGHAGGGHAGGGGSSAGHSGGFSGGMSSRSSGFVGGGGSRVGGSISSSHGGGFAGGGIRVGGGFGSAGFFRGGNRGFGGFGGFNRGFRGFYPYYGGFYSPYYSVGYGFGYGYSPSYYDYGYYGPAYSEPAYESPSNAMVYQQPAPTNIYVERANPVTRSYDEYGQPSAPAPWQQSPSAMPNASAGSPVYLIAFADHTIRATAAYWVEGSTLHYVTLEHEHKQTPLASVDRAMSLQLNRERHVSFALPTGQ
jgi:hypothetical protein